MTDSLARMIESASGTLTLLTKIRCVESYPLPSDCTPKNLFSWPNTQHLDKEDACFLESKGVFMCDNYVKSYPVPYNLYDKMKKTDSPSVATIKATRALLDAFQIISCRKPITGITAAWNAAEHPNRAVPTCVSDAQGLRDFGAHKDSFLIFHIEDEKYDIKLRAAVFPAVLQEKPEISGCSISRGDLREFVGGKVDGRGRKNRNIVFQANEAHLRRVVQQTNDAVEKLVGNNNLANEINNIYQAQRR